MSIELTFPAVNLLAVILAVFIVLSTCGLGLLVVGPFFVVLHVVTYPVVTGQQTEDQFSPVE